MFLLLLFTFFQVQTYDIDDGFYVLISSSKDNVTFSSYRLSNPERIVLEINGQFQYPITEISSPILKVEKTERKEFTRLTFHVKDGSFYTVLNRGNEILVGFRDKLFLDHENFDTITLALKEHAETIARKELQEVKTDESDLVEIMLKDLELSRQKREEEEKRIAELQRKKLEEERLRRIKEEEEKERRLAELQRKELEEERLRKIKEEEERRLAELQRKKLEEERLRRIKEEKEKEKERRLAELQRKKLEEERLRKIKEEEEEKERRLAELQRKKLEEERLRKIKEEEEEKERRLAELQRKKLEEERLRRIKEEKEKERRLAELQRKELEEERLRKIKEEEEEKERRLAELQRKKLEEERLRKIKEEEEERRLAELQRKKAPAQKKAFRTEDGKIRQLKVVKAKEKKELPERTSSLPVTKIGERGRLKNLLFRKFPNFSRISLEITGDIDYQFREIKGGFVIDIRNFSNIPQHLLNIIDTRAFNAEVEYIYPKRVEDIFKIYIKADEGIAVRKSEEKNIINLDFFVPTIE